LKLGQIKNLILKSQNENLLKNRQPKNFQEIINYLIEKNDINSGKVFFLHFIKKIFIHFFFIRKILF